MDYAHGSRPLDSDIGNRSKRCGIIRALVLALLLGLGSLGTGVNGWTADDDGSRLTIVSPAQGAVIKGDSVDVQYQLSKGVQATHVHCYLDGEYQRGFKGVLKGLARGPHEIKVVAANHDHSGLVAEATVTIEVE
ncbi:MAG: hypothetical protein U0223_06700 [Nitrospira sp.]|nr:hypothetical protein [Nitrospira sp.]